MTIFVVLILSLISAITAAPTASVPEQKMDKIPSWSPVLGDVHPDVDDKIINLKRMSKLYGFMHAYIHNYIANYQL